MKNVGQTTFLDRQLKSVSQLTRWRRVSAICDTRSRDGQSSRTYTKRGLFCIATAFWVFSP